LRFLRNSTDFQADYMTVVEDRPIMSVNHCLPVLVFYFWQKFKTITHPAARSLCDSWASCVIGQCSIWTSVYVCYCNVSSLLYFHLITIEIISAINNFQTTKI